MSEKPSSRIVEQRLRNRVLECFEYLSDGDQAVRTLGFKEKTSRLHRSDNTQKDIT